MVALLGVPYDSNSSFLRGPALAPPRIRLMARDGSANNFSELGPEIVEGKTYRDFGDLTFPDLDPKQAFERIRDGVAGLLSQGYRVLSLGGDHSVSYPIVAAHSAHFSPFNILHLDAHGDLYDNFDNNPYSHASPFARIMEQGLAQSLTQVGIRALTAHQREQAKRFGVEIVEMREFSFNFISKIKGPLYISLDLDVLDPAFAPGVSHHEPGGLSVRDVLHILQKINVPIIGADIVEYNPARDLNDQTAMVGFKMMKELMAVMIKNPLAKT